MKLLSHLNLLFTLAFRNVRRNLRRSLLTCAAIAIALLSANMLTAFQNGMLEQMIDDTLSNLTGHIQLHNSLYLDDPVAINSFPAPVSRLEDLKSKGIIKQWTSRLRVPAIIRSERETAGLSFLGISPEKEKELTFFGTAAIKGRFVSSEQETGLVIGERLADFLQSGIGSRVVITTQDSNGDVAERGFRIVGLYRTQIEAMEKAYAVTGFETAKKLLNHDKQTLEVSIRAYHRDDFSLILSALATSNRSELGKNQRQYVVHTWRELEPFLVAMMKMHQGFLWLWYMIVTVTVVFGLVNTLFMIILERVREFGLFQALGMSQGNLRLQVVVESFVLLLFGIVIGNLMSSLLLIIFQDGIDLSAFTEAVDMFGVSSTVFLRLTAKDFLLSSSLIICIGILGSMYPAWRASRLLPVEALRKV